MTRALANSTKIKKIHYIDDLYLQADELREHGALDRALGTLNDCHLGEILELWFV